MTAAVAGADDVVSLLIAAKADLDVELEPGVTALFMAAAAGQAVCLTKLLEAGASTTMKNSVGLTPLDAAHANGHDICAMFLREAAEFDMATDEDLWEDDDSCDAVTRGIASKKEKKKEKKKKKKKGKKGVDGCYLCGQGYCLEGDCMGVLSLVLCETCEVPLCIDCVGNNCPRCQGKHSQKLRRRVKLRLSMQQKQEEQFTELDDEQDDLHDPDSQHQMEIDPHHDEILGLRGNMRATARKPARKAIEPDQAQRPPSKKQAKAGGLSAIEAFLLEEEAADSAKAEKKKKKKNKRKKKGKKSAGESGSNDVGGDGEGDGQEEQEEEDEDSGEARRDGTEVAEEDGAEVEEQALLQQQIKARQQQQQQQQLLQLQRHTIVAGMGDGEHDASIIEPSSPMRGGSSSATSSTESEEDEDQELRLATRELQSSICSFNVQTINQSLAKWQGVPAVGLVRKRAKKMVKKLTALVETRQKLRTAVAERDEGELESVLVLVLKLQQQCQQLSVGEGDADYGGGEGREGDGAAGMGSEALGGRELEAEVLNAQGVLAALARQHKLDEKKAKKLALQHPSLSSSAAGGPSSDRKSTSPRGKGPKADTGSAPADKRNAIRCRYFNTPGGCSRGDSCAFLHERSIKNGGKNAGQQTARATSRQQGETNKESSGAKMQFQPGQQDQGTGKGKKGNPGSSNGTSNSNANSNSGKTNSGGSGAAQAADEWALPWNYKTQLCSRFKESGKCYLGERCQFAHGQSELRTLPNTAPSAAGNASSTSSSSAGVSATGSGSNGSGGGSNGGSGTVASGKADKGDSGSAPADKRNAIRCRYFNTPGGCSRGDSCAFLHERLGPSIRGSKAARRAAAASAKQQQQQQQQQPATAAAGTGPGNTGETAPVLSKRMAEREKKLQLLAERTAAAKARAKAQTTSPTQTSAINASMGVVPPPINTGANAASSVSKCMRGSNANTNAAPGLLLGLAIVALFEQHAEQG
eukprot:g1095.t1